MYVVGHRRGYLEAVFCLFWLHVLRGLCVAWRQRRYREAGSFASSGGLVLHMRSWSSANLFAVPMPCTVALPPLEHVRFKGPIAWSKM